RTLGAARGRPVRLGHRRRHWLHDLRGRELILRIEVGLRPLLRRSRRAAHKHSQHGGAHHGVRRPSRSPMHSKAPSSPREAPHAYSTAPPCPYSPFVAARNAEPPSRLELL